MELARLLRIYWFAILSTLVIWILIGGSLGLGAFATVIILTFLEITFSADNAVVNSRVLVTLSPFWQKMFMTVGIFIAVFIIRFILPIVIVMITASLGFKDVLDLALNHPHEYEKSLHEASPLISAFGGSFLIMTALGYFIDYQKETHWIKSVEKGLKGLDRFRHFTPYTLFLTAIILYLTVDDNHKTAVWLAAVSAIALHVGLDWLNSVMGKNQQKSKTVHRVGMAAFAAFLYLEILDASFSLDGVIGSFAITSNIIIIMAGLGAGAVWVRAMTIHLVRAEVLSKYIFLEHGAHWAIAFLGSIMLLQLYHIELPEWVVGGLGIAFISLSIWRSIVYTRTKQQHTHKLHAGSI